MIDRAYLEAQIQQFRLRHHNAIRDIGAIEGAIQILQQLLLKDIADEEDEAKAADLLREHHQTLREVVAAEADDAIAATEAPMRLGEDDDEAQAEPSETPNAPWVARAGPPTIRPQDKWAVKVQELDHEHDPVSAPSFPPVPPDSPGG